MSLMLTRGSVVFVLAIGTAVIAAVMLTRGTGPTASVGVAGHGQVADSDSATSIMLRPEDERRIGVTYSVASLVPLIQAIRVIGQVTAAETREAVVSLKVDGWVERLFVDFTGREVRAGEPLLELYSPMVASAAEELLLARRLQADVGEDSSEAAVGARSLVASARRRLSWWDVPPDQIRRIEQSGEATRTVTLRAPFDGVVIAKNVVLGQQVMAGQSLFRLADLSVVWVEGEVFEQDLPRIRLGQPVDAEFNALPGTTRVGRIVFIHPTLDRDTRTTRVRVELPNPRRDLKPGMYATLHVSANEARRDLSVPRSAVLSTGARSLVFRRVSGGRLEPREVRVGLATDDRIQILEGLSAGDTVVASATFLVDAESNLGVVLGGMGDMPGMDMLPPVQLERGAPADPRPAVPADPHAGHGR